MKSIFPPSIKYFSENILLPKRYWRRLQLFEEQRGGERYNCDFKDIYQLAKVII